MEIKIEAKLKMEYKVYAFSGDKLSMKIKYKLPYKKFKVKDEITLCYEPWARYEGEYESFQKDVIYHLRNEDVLKEVAMNQVKERIKNDEKELKLHEKDNKIKHLLRELEKMTFNVKIEE